MKCARCSGDRLPSQHECEYCGGLTDDDVRRYAESTEAARASLRVQGLIAVIIGFGLCTIVGLCLLLGIGVTLGPIIVLPGFGLAIPVGVWGARTLERSKLYLHIPSRRQRRDGLAA